MGVSRLFISCLALVASQTALACLYYPRDYKGTVTEGTREFFLFSTGAEVHLVMKTALSTSKKLPERLSWVVPFQSMPTAMKEGPTRLFEELFAVTPVPLTRGFAIGSKGATKASAITVHEERKVGRYTLHPIEINSTDDLKETSSALDGYLKSKNFISIPFDLQRPYLKKGAVFLAIELNTSNMDRTELTPLHLTFKKTSDQFSIPLKLTHDTRIFNLRVYTVGATPLFDGKKDLEFGRVMQAHPIGEVSEIEAFSGDTKALLKGLSGELRAYRLDGLNSRAALKTRKLTRDLVFNFAVDAGANRAPAIPQEAVLSARKVTLDPGLFQ